MRFSHVAIVYTVMGVLVVSAGVVPIAQLGIASVFVDAEDGSVEANRSAVGGTEEGGGMLDNLIGPVRNALNTISGGALIAVWTVIDPILGLYAWPLTTASAVNAPFAVQLFASVLVVSFTLAGFRVVRPSI
jgi:hypothetical protein